MINEELKNYIQKARRSGLDDSVIKQELLNLGWDPGSVDQVLQKRTIKTSNFNKVNILAIILGAILVLIPSVSLLGLGRLNPIVLIGKLFKNGLDGFYALLLGQAIYYFLIGSVLALVNKTKSYSAIWITNILYFVFQLTVLLILRGSIGDVYYLTLASFFIFASLGYYFIKLIFYRHENTQ